jgi:4-amino-4-deoxy-L-arabinose transferase-like glycosyltransferase
MAYAVFVLAVLLMTVWIVDLDRPCYHDECHFVETVERFGRDMSLTTIRRYNEMSTPLPFILYALWGRLFGSSLRVLRLFSLLVAVVTYALFYRLLARLLGRRSITFASAAFLILNPYMIGLSVFVYTDMLTLLFIILSCMALLQKKPVVLFVSLSAGLLCRQFTVFLVLALAVFYTLRAFISRDRHAQKMLLACGCALVPLGALIILWRGLSPDNAVRTVYLDAGINFHSDHLMLYLTMFCVYLLPFVVVNWRHVYRDVRVLVVSFVLAWTYWLSPVSASVYTRMIDKYTTGFFHRAVLSVTKSDALVHVIYFILYMTAIPVLWYIIHDLVQGLVNKRIDFSFFLDVCIMWFLVIMPFAYMAWEKYFLLIMPIGIMRLVLTAFPPKTRVLGIDTGCA